MSEARLCLHFDRQLRFFLAPANRGESVRVRYDGTASLGHVVQSLRVPLTEVGLMTIGAVPVAASHRPADGDIVVIQPTVRPQLPSGERRSFVLDVHLGSLARRLRLVGVDTGYRNDASDDELLARANAERRILLTKDRGLLCRKALWLGGYVRGSDPGHQLRDVLERFAPELAPWTRCPACNAELADVPKAVVEPMLEPGTRRSFDTFARCSGCGQVYWHGAHGRRLEAVVNAAMAAVRPARGGPRAPDHADR